MGLNEVGQLNVVTGSQTFAVSQAQGDVMRGIVDDDEVGSDNEARAVQFCGTEAKYARVREVARLLDDAEERGRARQERKMAKEVLRAQEDADRLRQEAISTKCVHAMALNEISALVNRKKETT